MTWEQIAYNIEQFWNKPVPIIGFTIGALIIGVFTIFKYTSIGKKSIKLFKEKYQELKEKYQETCNTYDKIVKEKDEIIANMQKMYEEKLALVQANRDKEREIIIAIGEKINNVKIKKIIEEYKNYPEITDICEVLESKKQELEEQYKAKETELEEKINEKLAQIDLFLNKLEVKEDDKVSE